MAETQEKRGEFALIAAIKSSFRTPAGVLGIGDDCAVIPQREGMETLVSTDMLMEDVHFLMDSITPYELGWKSAAVNVSDIAAMGGKPLGSFLAFSLPEGLAPQWCDAFVEGYKALSELYGCSLLGGDTTSSKSKLCICVTVMGECPVGSSLKRSAARPGDFVCVTGALGDSSAGLDCVLNTRDAGSCVPESVLSQLRRAHYLPKPRVAEGEALRKAGVHACMDVSDGIASDLRHICVASAVSAEVELASLPLSDELKIYSAAVGKSAFDFALEGGEDYELLFTADEAALSKLEIEYHKIGRIVPASSEQIRWMGADKDYLGFRHF